MVEQAKLKEWHHHAQFDTVHFYTVPENCNVGVFAMPDNDPASPTLDITLTHIFHVSKRKTPPFWW